jgi:hypothetical protein
MNQLGSVFIEEEACDAHHLVGNRRVNCDDGTVARERRADLPLLRQLRRSRHRDLRL